MNFSFIQNLKMIEQLENQMRKISVTNQMFQYKQNNQEFKSILIVLDNSGLNAWLSLAHTAMKNEKNLNTKRINSTIMNQRRFSDGTTFESHFREIQKIGKV